MTPALFAVLIGFALLLYILVGQSAPVYVDPEELVIPEPKFKGDIKPEETTAWMNRIHNIRTKGMSAQQLRDFPMDMILEVPQRTPQCSWEWSPMFDKGMDPFLRDLARSYFLNSNYMYREFLVEIQRIMREQWGADEGEDTT